MIDKQGQETTEREYANKPILEHYYTNGTHIHYIPHNLFRGLKPVRRKYRLTINEIIFLNGMYLYCRHVSTCFSQDACLRYVGYCNLNKIKYYIGSLHSKKMIEVAEILRGNNHYRLTEQGISAVTDIDNSFVRCLAEWCQKNKVDL